MKQDLFKRMEEILVGYPYTDEPSVICDQIDGVWAKSLQKQWDEKYKRCEGCKAFILINSEDHACDSRI